jgi:hypothetical protein
MSGISNRRRRRRLATAIGVGALAATLLVPNIALAGQPSGQASCMGIELAAISPPGTSDEEPGGAPQFVAEIKSFADSLGVPGGALFAFVASLHEGGHDQCDEALE